MGNASGAVKKEVEQLGEKLRHHEYLYHVLDEPEISDAAYDKLMKPAEGARSGASRVDLARFADGARRRASARGFWRRCACAADVELGQCLFCGCAAGL